LNERAQIFVDQFGTRKGPGNPNGGPNWQPEEGKFWLLAWQGRVDLWKVFWVYFFFGHGIVLGLGCGLIVFSMLAGFAIDPGSIVSGAKGLAVGLAVLALVFLVFAVWSMVSVWRCADNCTVKIRGTYARVIMVGYATALALPVVNFVWV